MASAKCCVCEEVITDDVRLVIVRGRAFDLHCSERCLGKSVRRQHMARAVARRRWSMWLGGVAGLCVLAALVARHRAPPPAAISFGWPETRVEDEEPAEPPIVYGPAWPPTDDDWTFAFSRVSWVFPLPGPERHALTPDGHIYGFESLKKHFKSPPKTSGKRQLELPSPVCRAERRCGVDLGGNLWGEHVYAALDGIVDRVQGDGNEGDGGVYVRLSHFGGMAFTQYFHLAATPRQIVRGARVAAGDVIGLLGDTGLQGDERHLHFALSVRPAATFAETYWDPAPLMTSWRLKRPTYGTVAGFNPTASR